MYIYNLLDAATTADNTVQILGKLIICCTTQDVFAYHYKEADENLLVGPSFTSGYATHKLGCGFTIIQVVN